MLRREGVALEVGEARLVRDRLAQREHPVEECRQFVPVRQVRLRPGAEGALPDRPVGVLEVGLQLRDRLRLPVPFHRQATGALLVAGRELLE
ncbi:hypothetical protein RZS08_64170, partial [Arthrospira platensis SPKY1]|nr:hypothetical protein [Arthrospira platensis SPKY1]